MATKFGDEFGHDVVRIATTGGLSMTQATSDLGGNIYTEPIGYKHISTMN